MRIAGLDHIVVVATAHGAANFQLSAEVGSRFPALISATGRCIAAFGGYRDTDLEARFATLRWEDPPSFDDWQEQVAATRTKGFAVDAGNYIAGVTVLAAPVWQTEGRPSHALVAIGLDGALKRHGHDAPGEGLLGAARTLSEQLG